ncbi:SDR family oxidoreductase [Allokutzneria sp. A3M-2-11 16]|uniref:SDR family oxidoreductase n=1 Tax=Allokutzneria sp. A3M-2-11 16 TaxID=2962043 RepID=UPI0020B8BA98|nr:SDR family oxidoreductase [Allokutzneria sp. A3M-2-11 16]MCP3804049.1 SDR family oxidoreductase [Allokutzneria sp. A3M-2-11 16]
MLIVVTGATGTVGRRVVARLTSAGQQIRALARDARQARDILGADVEIVPGDFSLPDSLEPALSGAERIFLLSPDLPGTEKLRLEANAVTAAERAGVKHIVYLSVPGRGTEPEFAFARLHRETEQRIERSGLAWTHLRPIAFMSNLLLSAESIRTENAFHLPTGDGKVSCIDPDDIAAVAVEALTADGHEGRAYTLTGAEALSHAEQAERLSAVLGRPITFVDVPEAAAREAMLASGVPDALVEDLLEFYALVKAGERVMISPDFERVTGREPATFTSFAERAAAAFR